MDGWTNKSLKGLALCRVSAPFPEHWGQLSGTKGTKGLWAFSSQESRESGGGDPSGEQFRATLSYSVTRTLVPTDSLTMLGQGRWQAAVPLGRPSGGQLIPAGNWRRKVGDWADPKPAGWELVTESGAPWGESGVEWGVRTKALHPTRASGARGGRRNGRGHHLESRMKTMDGASSFKAVGQESPHGWRPARGALGGGGEADPQRERTVRVMPSAG